MNLIKRELHGPVAGRELDAKVVGGNHDDGPSHNVMLTYDVLVIRSRGIEMEANWLDD